MEDELQYQLNRGYVERLLKLRYNNAMRLWGEANSNSTLRYRANLTTGLLEEYISSYPIYNEETIGNSYQKQLQCLLCLIEDEEERKITNRILDRKHLVEIFEQGEREVEIAYRRKFDKNHFKWVRCQIVMVLEPEKMQIIGFGIEREILQTWSKKTISKVLLNHLYSLTNTMYFNVLAINYDTYIYDTIQTNDKNNDLFPLKGNIGTLLDDIHTFYHENSYDFLDFLRSGDRIRHELQNKEQIVWEVQVKNKGKDTYIWIEHRILPVEESMKDCNYFLLLTIDITERKMREEALKEALARSERAGLTKQIFLSHMSHEIRTPLNGIMGMIQLIQEEMGMEQNEYLNNVMISSKHLKALLNDVLDMARLECGKIKLQKSWMWKEDFFKYIDNIIEPMARKKGVRFSYYHKQTFKAVYVDIGRLQQIMINLLTNAIKYNHEGGTVTLLVDTQVLHDNHEKIFFCVEDNGKGMSEEFQMRAFDPFEQEEQSETRTGTGLGLTIAKMLVSLMDGTITIESKQNVGTKITVIIEAIGSNEPKKAENCLDGPELVNAHKKLHCLLIEDNKVNREIVKTYINEMGIVVDTATDGLQGIHIFSSSEENYYDIIFMDVILPEMNGLEAAGRIRKMEREDARRVPIVAMTANVFSEDIQRIYESGMNDYLLKPFEKRELHDLILKKLKKSADA